ncbi:MAG: hypothetical protein ACYCQJ_12715 [Nitrososphaerales archaeon]
MSKYLPSFDYAKVKHEVKRAAILLTIFELVAIAVIANPSISDFYFFGACDLVVISMILLYAFCDQKIRLGQSI